uniref:DDE Tnp4 domain-containing protein n=1 Tax=Spongospora subterranea TaxID=70186 RepID=A0A0H5R5L1_9EUKA|eukprot:CRZ03474.1 hypothetical protein [Spongospora subterranea]
MVRVSERSRLLRDLDGALVILVVQQILFRYSHPVVAARARKTANMLMVVKAGVMEQRFINTRRKLSKELGALKILPLLEVDEFIQEVRVCQQTFAFILHEIEDDPIFHNNSTCPQRETWIQLACALDRIGHFGNGSAVGRVARAKGIGYGSVILYTKRVIHALKNLSLKYIYWPDASEREKLSAFNLTEFGFDNCILSTDGTHVVLAQKPNLDGEVYYNRKCTYSMNVMLTFDHKRQIRYLIAGWPGSVHDSSIWESGHVHKDPERYFSPGQYQFGDSGFSLTRQMLVPYRQPAASVAENEEFNFRLSRGRVVSEHGNGILKGRWQSLRALPICINKGVHVNLVCDWIVASCVLHNIVNSRRLVADEVPLEPVHEEDALGQGGPNQIIHDSLQQWRRDIQQKVLHYWA